MDLFFMDILKFTSKGMNFESKVQFASIEEEVQYTYVENVLFDISLWEANHCLGIFKYALGVAIFLYAYLKSHVVRIEIFNDKDNP